MLTTDLDLECQSDDIEEAFDLGRQSSMDPGDYDYSSNGIQQQHASHGAGPSDLEPIGPDVLTPELDEIVDSIYKDGFPCTKLIFKRDHSGFSTVIFHLRSAISGQSAGFRIGALSFSPKRRRDLRCQSRNFARHQRRIHDGFTTTATTTNGATPCLIRKTATSGFEQDQLQRPHAND